MYLVIQVSSRLPGKGRLDTDQLLGRLLVSHGIIGSLSIRCLLTVLGQVVSQVSFFPLCLL